MNTSDKAELAIKRRRLEVYKQRLLFCRDALNREFYRKMIDDLESDLAVAALLEELNARDEVHTYNIEFDSLARALETIRDPDVIVHSLETTWKVTGWLWWKRKVKIWKVKISYR